MLERKEPFIKKPMMDNYDILRMRQTSEMMIKSARCDRVPLSPPGGKKCLMNCQRGNEINDTHQAPGTHLCQLSITLHQKRRSLKKDVKFFILHFNIRRT